MKFKMLRLKNRLKTFIWSLFQRVGINSNPIYFSIMDTINDFSNSNLYNWRYYFKSRHKEPELANGDVVCIMCTWMEEKMVPLALESSKDFVSRYIVVDKDGGTVPVIESCRDKWGLDMEIYVKPEMSLRESRAFALTRIDEPWVLIQDGDEVFHTDGPNSINELRKFMDRPHIVLMAPMIHLDGDLWHTSSNNPLQSYHEFLYHNNGTIRKRMKLSFHWDIPMMNGWKTYIPKIFKFNCKIKSPKRLFLRQFWNEWCIFTVNYLKYSNIEDYVIEELGINIENEAKAWYPQYIKSLITYDEKRWGYYPEVIRKYIFMQREIAHQYLLMSQKYDIKVE